jgi:dipeptidyl aminopeptidase/acylaminoacyl peptidase
MSRETLEQALVDWLDAQSSTPIYLAETMERTRRVRQRPAWTYPERWLPVQLTMSRPLVSSRPVLSLLVVAALILAVVVAALVGALGAPRLAPPFGSAANGLLAFDMDGAIYVAHEDGSAPSVLATGVQDATGPVFSPDGSRLAFMGMLDGAPTLFVSGADGRSATPVSRGLELDATARETRPSWSPGSDRLVFTGLADDGTYRIHVARADGTQTVTIGSVGRSALDPAWSPDGQWIAFHGYDPAVAGRAPAYQTTAGLYVIRPDGSGERAVIEPATAGDFEFRKPQWRPDPGLLEIATQSGMPSHYDIVVVDVASGESRMISRSQEADTWPVWSPDATLLAWGTSETGEHIARADGTLVRTIRGPDYESVWSPDGKWLFGWKDEQRTSAVLAPTDGSGPLVEIPTSGTSVSHWSWQRRAP